MCGIYKITNKINGKCYIGQSIHIEQRWKEHQKVSIDSNDKRYEYPLYKDMRKYGIDNFSFSILIQCNRSDLGKMERFYIDQYNSRISGYNQSHGANHHFIKNRLDWESVE